MTPASEAGGAPYFFLSYAHTPKLDRGDPDPDRWVFRLYKDLCEDIINLSTVPSDCAGFMDREMQTGTDWPRRLAEALATCRVFVPLYSPRYFLSEACGREWLAFTQRAAVHSARRGEATEAIVPALWVTVEPKNMPEVAQRIQFDHKALGARYSREGFYGIMKLGRYRAEYKQAVFRLAKRIVEVANHTSIEVVQPYDYQAMHSAFGPDESFRKTGQRIDIMVAAPDRQHLPDGRGAFYYGPAPGDWNPFRPECSQPLASYAAELTRGMGFRPVITSIAEQTGDVAGQAVEPAAEETSSAPGLLLTDLWEAATDLGQERLRKFDQSAEPWVSPLVPVNKDDAQTVSAQERLASALGSCLSRTLARIPAEYKMAANGIPTLENFGALLQTMAYEVGRRYLREAPAFPPSGTVGERPRLEGPHLEDPGDPP
jgi:FxsC-like protein